jgi:ADP-ribose pyrophosphatase YjhB (NUDIX family)
VSEIWSPRRAARVVLLDAHARVLLIRYNAESGSFWCTPGGAVEAGETDREAATRELHEELRLALPLQGPVHTAVSRFRHEGRSVENTDIFFTATLPRSHAAAVGSPAIYAATALEAETMCEARWWTAAELRSTAERTYPLDLADLIDRITQRPR